MRRILSLIVVSAWSAVALAQSHVVNPMFIQQGTGATARTFLDKARDFVSVKDFGIVCNGSTDETAKWATAVAAALANGYGLRVPPGTCIAKISVRGNNFSLIGAGSSRTTIKHPAGAASNVLELGDTASGNSATAYSNITIRGVTLDGNKASVTAPGTDLVGHCLPLTKISKFHISDVRAVNCHNAGVGIFILSNYGYADVAVENSGNATLTGPGFDVNSSSYNVLNVTCKDCYDGVRLLDNAFHNTLRAVVQNASRHGSILNNQNVNESYGNLIDVTVDTAAQHGMTVGPNVRNNDIRLAARNVGDTGLIMALQNVTTKTFDGSSGAVVVLATEIITVTAHGWVTGSRVMYSAGAGTAITPLVAGETYWVIRTDNDHLKLATSAAAAAAGTAINLTALGTGVSHTLTENLRSVGNEITLTTARSAAASLYLGGDSNSVRVASYQDGRAGAVGAVFAVDVNGDSNTLDVALQDANPWKVRGIAVRAGATENVIKSYSFTNTQDPFIDLGTRTKADLGTGLGTAIASAGTITLPYLGNTFHVTGNTGITDITGGGSGRLVTLIFDGTPTVTKGAHWLLASNFVATANSTLTGVWDGTNFYELGRGEVGDVLFRSAASTLTFNIANASVGTVTSTGLNSVAVGASTPSTGAFTSLTASGAVTLSPSNANVVASPTGTGTVTVNPATAGTLNNVSIGVTTAAAGRFTSATVVGANDAAALASGGGSVTGAGTTALHQFTGTWNTSGVVPGFVQANVTNTASGAGSRTLELQRGGALQFGVTSGAASTGLQVRTAQATVPTCSANCGTSPSVAGTDTAGIVTMGASGAPASGWVVTFNGTWAAAPSCVVQSALGSMVVGKMPIAVATTTTTLTVTTNGTAPANSDKYAYHCIGVQ